MHRVYVLSLLATRLGLARIDLVVLVVADAHQFLQAADASLAHHHLLHQGVLLSRDCLQLSSELVEFIFLLVEAFFDFIIEVPQQWGQLCGILQVATIYVLLEFFQLALEPALVLCQLVRLLANM